VTNTEVNNYQNSMHRVSSYTECYAASNSINKLPTSFMYSVQCTMPWLGTT